MTAISSPPVHLVLFDWDGTLIDSRDALVRAWHQSTQQVIGRTFPATEEEYADTFVRRGLDIFADITPDAQAAGDLARRFDEVYIDQAIEPFQGVRSLLGALKERGFAIAVVTSKARVRFERDAVVAGLTDLIDVSVCGDDVRNAKPDPEPVLRALTLAGVPADRAILIGDTVADVGAGVAAGVRVVGAGWGYGEREVLLELGANTVLDSPEDLSGIVEDTGPRTVDARLTPPTSKGRDTRQRILESATRLFGEHGYANVRITDITEAAGLSQGAFYRYFKDRREVVLELLRRMTAEAFDFVKAPWDESDPMASVLRSTVLYFSFYERNRNLFAVLVELSMTDPDVRDIWDHSRHAFYGRIAHSLRRGVSAGVLRDDLDIQVAAEMLGGMSEFYAFQRFVLGSIKDVPQELATRVLAEIWIGGTIERGRSR